MGAAITTLLELVPDDVQDVVRKTRDRIRTILQDALRSECRLVMRTPEESDKKLSGARVPVEVVPGYPVELEIEKITSPPQYFPFLTRYRSALRKVEEGILKLDWLVEEMPQDLKQHTMKPTTVQGMRDTWEFCRECLKRLDLNDPIIEILKVESDVLGVYVIVSHPSTGHYPPTREEPLRGERAPNAARIQLFWAVIGLVASSRGWSVEDLTIVVLTHELAHTYTQLGADIDGRRWPPTGFLESDVALKEGLAQYYTNRVLKRLPEPLKGASLVFEQLLTFQPAPYHAHEPWEKCNPEAIRSAMLQVRRRGKCSLEMFETCLSDAQGQLS